MKRKLVLAAVCLSLLLPNAVRADDAVKDALSLVPADAIGFVCVPNIQQLDASFQNTLEKLGLSAFVPPPTNSLAGAMRVFLRMSAGLDDGGALLLVLMPAETPDEFDQKIALLVPATDPKLLLEAMGAEAGEGGTWSLELFEEPIVAAACQKHVALAKNAETVKAVAASTDNITKKLNPNELALFAGLKVAAWFDAQRMCELHKPQIEGLKGMLMMMQQAGGVFGAKQAESTEQAFDLYTQGLRSCLLGLSLDDNGLGLRLGMTTKPGTDLHKMTQVANTEGSLLKGLPRGKYMLAAGEILNPQAVDQAFESLDPYFEVPEGVETVDREQLGKLKDILKGWAKLHTAVRASVEVLPPGPDGLIGATFILDTTDSKKWIEGFTQVVDIGKKIVSDEQVKQVLDALIHDPQAETSGNVKIHHLKFDLTKLEDVDKEELVDVFTVIGKEGVLLRLAAADEKTVVVAFGGGSKRMNQAIEQARKSEAPLDEDPGIKRVAALLPKSRTSVFYLALDNVVALVRNIVKALDKEDEFPLEVGEINAPLAVVGRGGEGWSQADIFIPTELMVAAKDAIMTMMGMGGGPPGVEVETEGVEGEEQPAAAPEDGPK
ncbi:MAG TPA: hypothetical protein VM487_03740 [Phycisphaerae bacterium]|nr:hypothetical protein [Phycisphaerae bacterium]